jgi:adenylate cyclase
MERRLAAVLIADVAGYGSLSQTDEEGTRARFQADLNDVFEPKIAEHHGRLVKTMGDGLLVEFHSVVDAVRCAIEVQRVKTVRDAGLGADRRLAFRIGINLGDVIVEGDDIHGDGVNIADRVQGLAEPGGILIAGAAYDQVKNKIAARFEELGSQTLKNLRDPIRVYRVALDTPLPIAPDRLRDDDLKQEKPSIAVLPFVNMGDDPEQLYFSDGITEDIILGLSRFRQVLVIARNSSFQYRGKAVDVRRVARDLGVRFVVEGSVRKAGTRLRVTVQLIDATTGTHIWAERFDRELTDIFAVQDEIAQTIVASLAGRVEDVDRRRALRKSAGDLSSYDLLLRGRHCLERGSQQDVLAARDIFQRVIERDPEYAAAYIALAETYFYEAISSWTTSREVAAARLFELGRTAARLDDQDSRAHLCLAWGYWRVEGNFEIAKAQIEEAIALNPNDLDNYCLKGFLSTYAGELEEGIWCTSEAIRRAPNMPEKCLESRVMAEYLLGRYGDAIATFGRMSHPPVELLGWIAACYAELGRDSEARAATMQFRERARAERAGAPDDDTEAWRAYWLKAFPAREFTNVERLFAGLRKAGLPV